AGARARATSTTTRPAPPLHVQLDLVDRSRPAVDPAGTRSAPVRDLPTELYLPGGAGPHPLIVFAHGYDGDPSKFTELFGHWSDAGFAVAAPRFPITYTSDPVGPIARAGDIANQPRDMSFVLDQVLHGPYAGRIDRTRIAAAGLSLGGGTVWGLTTDRCCVDRRVRAAIVMDGNRLGFGDATYRPNRIPILVFHADHDYSLPYSAAQAAYAKLDPPKYFVTIVGALHAQPYENTPVPSDPMVVATSLDFLRAYLLHDAAARARIVTDATVAGVSSAEADPGR
ncbi:MAG: alpha/beta hydrolase family protein, partial [Acidimicrobiia bacterium]